MKICLWTVLLLLTVNIWWVFFLYVLPLCTATNRWGIFLLLPLALTVVSFVWGGCYIADNLDK